MQRDYGRSVRVSLMVVISLGLSACDGVNLEDLLSGSGIDINVNVKADEGGSGDTMSGGADTEDVSLDGDNPNADDDDSIVEDGGGTNGDSGGDEGDDNSGDDEGDDSGDDGDSGSGDRCRLEGELNPGVIHPLASGKGTFEKRDDRLTVSVEVEDVDAQFIGTDASVNVGGEDVGTIEIVCINPLDAPACTLGGFDLNLDSGEGDTVPDLVGMDACADVSVAFTVTDSNGDLIGSGTLLQKDDGDSGNEADDNSGDDEGDDVRDDGGADSRVDVGDDSGGDEGDDSPHDYGDNSDGSGDDNPDDESDGSDGSGQDDDEDGSDDSGDEG